MSLSDRDKKIVIVLVPLVLILGYWFLLLAPKREEAGSLGERLSQAEKKRDDAQALSSQLEGSKATYAKDYETVVRLGKAIPSTLDMPSLIVQLDHAADGTGIKFRKVRAGARSAAPPPPAPASGDKPAAAAGGEKASTGPGKATEQANDTKQAADAAAGQPAGGAAASTSGTPGLDSVPLEFSFSGSFFDLADFFHRMKRFVRVANEKIKVDGRLMTIDGLTFESSAFPTIKAEVRATVYLSPKEQGATAGATSQGPSTATPASSPSSAPAPSSAPVAQAGEVAR